MALHNEKHYIPGQNRAVAAGNVHRSPGLVMVMRKNGKLLKDRGDLPGKGGKGHTLLLPDLHTAHIPLETTEIVYILYIC